MRAAVPSCNHPPRNQQQTLRHQQCMSTAKHLFCSKQQGSKKMQPSRKVRAILDCGTQRTYITSRIQQVLSLQPSHSEIVHFKHLDQGAKPSHHAMWISVLLRRMVILCVVVPFICDPIHSQPTLAAREISPSVRSPSGWRCLSVELLIRLDYYWTPATGQVKKDPTVVDTRLGWVLSGQVEGMTGQQSVINYISTHSFRVDMLPKPNVELRKFWDLESLWKLTNEAAKYEEFTQQISFVNNRWGQFSMEGKPPNLAHQLWPLHKEIGRPTEEIMTKIQSS